MENNLKGHDKMCLAKTISSRSKTIEPLFQYIAS